MQKSISVSAALLAALPSVMAVGKAIVINNCDSAVNVWTADTERGQLGPDSLKAGGQWSEEYHMVGDGSASNGGVSIKLSTTDSCEGAITQYEYTYSSSGEPDLWYDISNVNCKGEACPFYVGGFYLEADTPVDCGPLTALCDAVYNLWNDDKATHGTESSKDTTLYLCGKDGSSSSVEISTEESSSTAFTSYSSTSFEVTPTPTYAASSTQIPTTLVTSTPVAQVQVESFVGDVKAAAVEEEENIITEVVTEYATAVVTQWAKRSPEPHAHHRREHRHHGHPHYRK
ncbi:Antigenic thaumatin-like protein [Lasiodiplodia hormozganensis]|uniref:Antigenic thaumatin-like protein n=1 Tax=Lasiodiplodia hormozganensis TaxID=869390 RepID=A0AA39XPW9_9PEZI|nr:Antigenic thaumatin-like protein [Lasiodiplodia hormozganensis]